MIRQNPCRIGVYIHIPFCVRKCPYCDFYSLPISDFAADDYVDALLRTIASSAFSNLVADTVYFGGGTPPSIGVNRLDRILDAVKHRFSVSNNAEITLEANPGSVTSADLALLRRSGFNRISFGVQSMQPNELKMLGRGHTARKASDAILAAHTAGFAEISADLMMAIPGQTKDSLAKSIGALASLPIQHLSAYLLKIEPDTPFMQQNIARLCPGEEETAALYLSCVEQLSQAGFEQYEISNFARNNAVSRHNLKYWESLSYLGLGPSAHSFLGGKRFYFPNNLANFCEAKSPDTLIVPDGDGGDFEEYAMLRLRLCEGLDIDVAAQLFQMNFDWMLKKALPLEKQGLLTIQTRIISLTPRGFLLSNAVTGALLF